MEKKGEQKAEEEYNPRVETNKEGTEKAIWLHQKYSIDNTSVLFLDIENLIQQLRKKQGKKEKKCHLYDVCQYTYYPLFEFILMKIEAKSQMCCICQYEYKASEDLYYDITHDSSEDIVSLGHCEHLFHKECISKYVGDKKWLKCPVCSVIYGVMEGDQPDGTIKVYVDNNMRCAGYDCPTIVVNYNFKAGTRNGRPYPATSRTGYLPDNPEGKKVAKLLELAFKRKLVFTIGRSVTTGQEHVIVWNGIHHKTALAGGSAQFGYPDPTYLIRVCEQLAAKGIY